MATKLVHKCPLFLVRRSGHSVYVLAAACTYAASPSVRLSVCLSVSARRAPVRPRAARPRKLFDAGGVRVCSSSRCHMPGFLP